MGLEQYELIEKSYAKKALQQPSLRTPRREKFVEEIAELEKFGKRLFTGHLDSICVEYDLTVLHRNSF